MSYDATARPVPVRKYRWNYADYTVHRTLSCANHPNLVWTSKNPFDRSVFYAGSQEDVQGGTFSPSTPQCDCSLEDMTLVYDPRPAFTLEPCKGDWTQRGCATGRPSVHHVTTHATPRDCCAYHSPYDVSADKPVGWSDEGYYLPDTLTCHLNGPTCRGCGGCEN